MSVVFITAQNNNKRVESILPVSDIAKPKDVSVEYGTRQLRLKWYHKDFKNFQRYEIVCGPRNGKKSEIRQENTFTGKCTVIQNTISTVCARFQSVNINLHHFSNKCTNPLLI